ncbi:unnamed protein product [Nesidiocoris tenuis]|uniref:Uncharacterized protein n=1 Tax=Nesidiocoris tenuis TaxID=355587 RepID=A0A6H5H0V8_9HEMI|nr:unnamed protein product [Nesidiocoris tenuis]
MSIVPGRRARRGGCVTHSARRSAECRSTGRFRGREVCRWRVETQTHNRNQSQIHNETETQTHNRNRISVKLLVNDAFGSHFSRVNRPSVQNDSSALAFRPITEVVPGVPCRPQGEGRNCSVVQLPNSTVQNLFFGKIGFEPSVGGSSCADRVSDWPNAARRSGSKEETDGRRGGCVASRSSDTNLPDSFPGS